MSLNRFLLSFTLLLSSTGATLTASATTAVVEPGPIQLVTPFTVASSTQVPGKTLKAGTYSIRVVDHLSDRVILQIEDAKGAAQTRFLGLENSALRTADHTTGPLTWANGANKTAALRGFSFPGGTTVEFVYPKEDAVLIAKENASKVEAIDPASEGKVAANHLSKDDLQTVTLWSLSPTRVGAEDAIEASRYQAPAQPTRVQIAGNVQDESSPRSGQMTRVSSIRQPRSPQPTQQVAVAHNPPLRALPHTASNDPLVALLGLIALCAGCALRYTRRFCYAA